LDLSTKIGPQGPSSAASIHSLAVIMSYYPNILKLFKRFVAISYCNLGFIENLINVIKKGYMIKDPQKSKMDKVDYFIGALAVIKDPECKRRIIATSDY